MHEILFEHRGDAFLLGHIHRLPLARLQTKDIGAEARDRGVSPTLKIELAAEALQRRQIGIGRRTWTQEGPSRGVSRIHFVSLVMGVRSVITEDRDRCCDQLRIGGAKLLRVESILCALRWRDVVNQYVRILKQGAQDFPPLDRKSVV